MLRAVQPLAAGAWCTPCLASAALSRHANGMFARTLGWGCFAIICVLAVAAPVLLIATNGGGG